GLERQRLGFATDGFVTVARRSGPLVLIAAEVVPFVAQGRVDIAALVQAPATGAVQLVAACAFDVVGACVLRRGTKCVPAQAGDMGKVELAQERLAFRVPL